MKELNRSLSGKVRKAPYWIAYFVMDHYRVSATEKYYGGSEDYDGRDIFGVGRLGSVKGAMTAVLLVSRR